MFVIPGATFVRRRTGEAYKPEYLIPTVKIFGGSVMVWACMSATWPGNMFLCDDRMNSTKYTVMLFEVMNPSMAKLHPRAPKNNIIFQQDNDPCHAAKRSRE